MSVKSVVDMKRGWGRLSIVASPSLEGRHGVPMTVLLLGGGKLVLYILKTSCLLVMYKQM